jgi:tripartite-type tricarboxylate transporter receptor subunit TctC
MKHPFRKMTCIAAAASAVGLVFSGPVLSQAPQAVAGAYPTKPIRLIVPWPAGGGTDINARIVAQKMTENIGQQIVVENRPGAAAIIGTDYVAKAAPDGYTLLMGNIGPNSANDSLYKKLPYDSIRDFAPVSLTTAAPYIMVVHPSVPAKSVKEFIALAKASPGKINFGSGGVGSAPHLAAELLAMIAGIKMEHISYKGGAAHTVALLSGEVDLTLNSPLEVLAHAQSGKLRALAVTTVKRSPVAPELPTMAEAGVPGYEFIVWWGVLAPARTPADLVAKVYAEVSKVLQAQDVRKRFSSQGVEVVGSSPEKFANFIKSEVAKWARVVKEAKIQPQ